MVDIKELEVKSESFSKLPFRLRHNHTLSEYVLDLANENKVGNRPDAKLERRASRIDSCSNFWEIEWYRLQGVKVITNTNRCRDRFCPNCQMSLSLKRVHKFSPILTSLGESNAVYHCVFTVKNCEGELLRSTIKQMYKSFSYLVSYLSGKIKIHGLDFSSFGFKGAVKSLEVTYNEKNDTYHPHLHCLIVFGKDLVLDKKFETVFSYSYSHDTGERFSEEELLIQRIWFLLNTRQKVTFENIEKVDVGYSVKFNKAEPEDYKEIFKYPFKADLKDGNFMNYEQFKLYDDVLHGLRYVQGYGDVLNYDFSDDEKISDEELDVACNELIRQCLDVENPVKSYERYTEMLDLMATGRYTYVTSGSVKKFILDYDKSL